MTPPPMPPPELMARYAATVGKIADIADGVSDFRPEARQRVTLCFAAAMEIMARDNPERRVLLDEVRALFNAFLRDTRDGNIKARARRTAEQPRDKLSIGHAADAG